MLFLITTMNDPKNFYDVDDFDLKEIAYMARDLDVDPSIIVKYPNIDDLEANCSQEIRIKDNMDKEIYFSPCYYEMMGGKVPLFETQVKVTSWFAFNCGWFYPWRLLTMALDNLFSTNGAISFYGVAMMIFDEETFVKFVLANNIAGTLASVIKRFSKVPRPSFIFHELRHGSDYDSFSTPSIKTSISTSVSILCLCFCQNIFFKYVFSLVIFFATPLSRLTSGRSYCQDVVIGVGVGVISSIVVLCAKNIPRSIFDTDFLIWFVSVRSFNLVMTFLSTTLTRQLEPWQLILYGIRNDKRNPDLFVKTLRAIMAQSGLFLGLKLMGKTLPITYQDDFSWKDLIYLVSLCCLFFNVIQISHRAFDDFDKTIVVQFFDGMCYFGFGVIYIFLLTILQENKSFF